MPLKLLCILLLWGALCQSPAAQTNAQPTGNMTLLSGQVEGPETPVGKGAANEQLVVVHLKTIGPEQPLTAGDFHFALDSITVPEHIIAFHLYHSSSSRLDTRNARLLGSLPSRTRALHFPVKQLLSEGSNYFWLTADIATWAPEGAQIGVRPVHYTLQGQQKTLPATATLPVHTVLLEHKLLFSGGDLGAKAFRIPALAAEGMRAVAVADARIPDNRDLPNNIDLVCRTSHDYGQHWSEPFTIANFGPVGASDPALVYDRKSQKLLCLFASHQGLFQSAPPNFIRFQVCSSTDFGKTWSPPREHTAEIYLPGWHAAWVASGSACQLADGRIVAAIGVRQNAGKVISNFMIYSDDGGNSWHTGPNVACTAGDEAKITALDDGRLMMLVRAPKQRLVTYSSDGGLHWQEAVPQPELPGAAVNGDVLRYASVKEGAAKNCLLYALAADPAQRRKLSIFMSEDEGAHWRLQKVICPGPSAYATLARFDDGSIGLFYENGAYEQYQLYFARFSLKWLTNGTLK